MKGIVCVGDRFGRWTVIGPSEERTSSRGIKWSCVCDCGKTRIVSQNTLRIGGSKSCGCLRKETSNIGDHTRTHGMSNTSLYGKWLGMKARCYNTNSDRYAAYGGRGITVCDEWLNDFMPFHDFAYANGYSKGLTIDRIDEDGDYSPSNCQFISGRDNTSKANKHNYLRGTGKYSKESMAKSKGTLRENLGIPCKIYLLGDEVIDFPSIGAAAEYMADLLDRKFINVYSHMKQIRSGKCETIAGYIVEFMQ